MIKIGRITDTIKKADNGIFGAHVVKIWIPDFDYEVTAYAKKLDNRSILVELMSALIGRELNLPIPEPVIAASQDGKDLLFASIDIKHPDLTRSVTCNETGNPLNTPQNEAIFQKISDWHTIEQSIGFDEWIANDDRNLGNVLFDGKDNFYLIDHNLAMRPPFSYSSPIQNSLMNIKILFSKDELSKQRLKNLIHGHIQDISTDLPQEISDLIAQEVPEFDNETLSDMVEFLENRLGNIPKITENKIQPKQMSI